jgi:hypothetical protein
MLNLHHFSNMPRMLDTERPSSATPDNDMTQPETPETNPERPSALAGATGSASGQRHRDCAAIGGPTISRMRGCINDEMKECIICGNSCRWDMTEHSFFGFEAACPQKPNDQAQARRACGSRPQDQRSPALPGAIGSAIRYFWGGVARAPA